MAFNMEVFLCYAGKDESAIEKLLPYLGSLQRQGFFEVWHKRKVNAGQEFVVEIDRHLSTAHIILLLVSQHFLDSDYCYLVEMQQAIERHERGDARVIPIILRPVYYQRAPFAKLQCLPRNSKPIMSSSWHNQDAAFYAVAEGIREVAEELAAILNQPKIVDIRESRLS